MIIDHFTYELFFFPQQAKEMVNEILRERDHAGFGDRNEYGSRMGGGGSGLNVCMKHLGTWVIVCIANRL